MKTLLQNWSLTHSDERSLVGEDRVIAHVPGAVQLDYADALGYKPYYYGMNFQQFDWMETKFFLYETKTEFEVEAGERAYLHISGIDYRFDILINQEVVYSGEGIFTPVRVEVTQYAGIPVTMIVRIYPIPRLVSEPRDRTQAAASCKPASSYGWDWHPRLVPIGIWGEAFLETCACGTPLGLEAAYRLDDDLSSVTVKAVVETEGNSDVHLSLVDHAGKTVCSAYGHGEVTLSLKQPELWYPRGYGAQPIYTLRAEGNEKTLERRIGFRRSRLVRNAGWEIDEAAFPKGPISAPAQIEINGRKIFAKGSNWVNTEIFPCLATRERYDELIEKAVDANMNIFRMWGGQYINHEYFYEKCDELGIMIWQEFMLSCNLHPDSDDYLSVLEQEAVSIIKRLRTHPCLTFWCGGNELFNSWSGMTQQAHPLRLLDKLCYEHDRFTPFQMTSPMHGVTHGSYVKVVMDPEADDDGEEFICSVKRTNSTGYTEFGCNGASPAHYIQRLIMDKSDYLDCGKHNPIWVAHHGFQAWGENAWLGIPEVRYFFGNIRSVDDLIEKSIYLQDMCYKSMFEEMRRQAPRCALAINWDFNEPWPCAAGNSLINWPCEPKSCLQSVKEALRPSLLSLNLPRNRWLTGENMEGEVWVLNDCDEAVAPVTVQVDLVYGEERIPIAQVTTGAVGERSNGKFGEFNLLVNKEIPERFAIELICETNPEMNSRYQLVHRLDL